MRVIVDQQLVYEGLDPSPQPCVDDVFYLYLHRYIHLDTKKSHRPGSLRLGKSRSKLCRCALSQIRVPPGLSIPPHIRDSPRRCISPVGGGAESRARGEDSMNRQLSGCGITFVPSYKMP